MTFCDVNFLTYQFLPAQLHISKVFCFYRSAKFNTQNSIYKLANTTKAMRFSELATSARRGRGVHIWSISEWTCAAFPVCEFQPRFQWGKSLFRFFYVKGTLHGNMLEDNVSQGLFSWKVPCHLQRPARLNLFTCDNYIYFHIKHGISYLVYNCIFYNLRVSIRNLWNQKLV